MTALRTSITVGTGDLRAALKAVRVHADTDKDSTIFRRIRLAADPQNLTVMATDTQTVGMALVSVLEHVNPGIDMIDITPADAARILTIFPSGKEGAEKEAPAYQVRIDLEPRHIVVTDASGMLDGRALRLPRLSSEDILEFEELPKVLSAIHHAHRRDVFGDAALREDLLERFLAAGAAYGMPIEFEGHASFRSLLVRVGESFIGTIWPQPISEEIQQRRNEWAVGWSARLPHPLSVNDIKEQA